MSLNLKLYDTDSKLMLEEEWERPRKQERQKMVIAALPLKQNVAPLLEA